MTSAQWNKIQAALPPEDRMTYNAYLASLRGGADSNTGMSKTATTTTAPTTAVNVLNGYGTAPRSTANPLGGPYDTATSGVVPTDKDTKDARDTVTPSTPITPSVLDNTMGTTVGGTTLAELGRVKAEVVNGKQKWIIHWSNGTDTVEWTDASDPDATPEITPTRPAGTPKAYVYNPVTKAWEKPPVPVDGKEYDWNDENGWTVKVVDPDNLTGGPVRPTGTPKAYVYNPTTKTWEKPPMPADGKTYDWNDETGWVVKTGIGTKKQPGKAWIQDANGNWVQPTKPTDGKTYNWNDETGWVLADNVTPIPGDNKVDYTDAFSIIEGLFSQWGMSGIGKTLARMLKDGLTPGAAEVKLKYDTTIDTVTGKAWNYEYATRFAGNVARVKNGLNAMQEGAYLALENSYAETLKAYGLTSMLSTDRAVNEAKFATWIAGDISGQEFQTRIATVEDRIVNADPNTLEAFKKFYPELSDKDLVAYFLDPKEMLPKLKEKTLASEIGGAALGQGLTADLTTAKDLGAYGIDLAGARAGYANVAEVLPTSGKLSNIYKEAGIDYTQKTGEAEFMKNNVNAIEQRRRLKSMERAKFMGDSGVSSQAGSLTKSTQGAF